MNLIIYSQDTKQCCLNCLYFVRVSHDLQFRYALNGLHSKRQPAHIDFKPSTAMQQNAGNSQRGSVLNSIILSGRWHPGTGAKHNTWLCTTGAQAKRPYASLGNGQTDVQSNNDVAQQLASIQPHVNLWLSAGAYHQKREFKWHEEFDLPVTQASRCWAKSSN